MVNVDWAILELQCCPHHHHKVGKCISAKLQKLLEAAWLPLAADPGGGEPWHALKLSVKAALQNEGAPILD